MRATKFFLTNLALMMYTDLLMASLNSPVYSPGTGRNPVQKIIIE